MKIKLLGIFACLICTNLFAQTFTRNPNVVVPNSNTIIDSVTVSGLSTQINTSLGLKDVMINITHSNVSDLTVWLIAPDGTKILLTENNGGSGNNYQNTHFNYNNGNSAIYFNGAPFNGNFYPAEWLPAVNNGQNPNGKWYLKVNDCCAFNQGTLVSWSVTFGNNPTFIADTTRLPIIEVFTNGNDIVDEPKITTKIKVIANAGGALNHYNDAPVYQGYAGMEFRGSTSQTFPQKPYAVQTWDSTGNNFDVSLLGFPKDHDWIFYPPYDDKSLMRNVLIYHLSNQMGHYASRTKYFELYVNGIFEGIYVLMEKVKRAKQRVSIAKLDTTGISGTALTGGYIYKIDKTTGVQNQGWNGISMVCDTPSHTTENMYYQYSYPDQNSIVPQQTTYLQNFVTGFENAVNNFSVYDTVNGYKKLVSISSFVDHSMLVEFARNVDGYRLSSYYHKDRDDKDARLKAGPIWDYNLSFGNADYMQGADWNVWEWDLACPGNPVWWEKFFNEDSVYRQEYKCHYTNYRQNILSDSAINFLIDSVENVVHYEQVKTYLRWPILGQYTWPNAYYPPTFRQEIDTLRSWTLHRLHWMDTKLYDTNCFKKIIDTIADTTKTGMLSVNYFAQSFKVYPNPISKSQQFFVEWKTNSNAPTTIELYGVSGVLIVSKENFVGNKIVFDAAQLGLPSGVYWVSLKTNEGKFVKKFIVE